MNRQEALKKLIHILQTEFNVNTEETIEECTKIILLGIDSIALMTLVVLIEESWNITIDFEYSFAYEHEKITIGNILDWIVKSSDK